MPCAAIEDAVGEVDTRPSSSDVDEAPLCIISDARPDCAGLKCGWRWVCVSNPISAYPCDCGGSDTGCGIEGRIASVAVVAEPIPEPD